MTATRIDLLRHGACSDGAIYRGHTDSPLSEEGLRQMQTTAAQGQWDLICSSPLQRCRTFARQLASERGVPLLVDQRLVELNFGAWDGQPTAQIWQQQQQAVLDFWRDPVANTPPGAEPLQALCDRAVQLLHEIGHQHAGQRLLIVSHGGVIRTLLGYLLQMPLPALQQLSIDYGSLSRVELYEQREGGHFGSEVIFTNRVTELACYERS